MMRNHNYQPKLAEMIHVQPSQKDFEEQVICWEE